MRRFVYVLSGLYLFGMLFVWLFPYFSFQGNGISTPSGAYEIVLFLWLVETVVFLAVISLKLAKEYDKLTLN